MSYIAATVYDGSRDSALFRNANFTGSLIRFLDTPAITPSFRRFYFPPATAAVQRHPSGGNYGNRQYLVGGHTANIMIDIHTRAVRQSIPAPDVKPSVSVGAGSTLQICYLRFYDELTDERSPLSEGISLTGNTTRVWTNLPTEVPNERVVMEGVATIAAGVVTGAGDINNFGDLRPGDRIAIASAPTRWSQVRSIANNASMTIDDTGMAGVGVELIARPYSRVSHIEQWVSVGGGLPRLATRVRIGTPSITESIASLALGQAETTSFTAMHRGEFNLFYNDRQLIAGVDEHRDTVFLSAIGFPERYEGLSFKTAYNEPIVGMFRFRDYVVLLCPDSSYKLQGYTEDDTVRTVLEPDIGGYGHKGNVVAGGRAYVPSRKGPMIFNGAFHPAIPTRLREWKEKSGRTIQGRLAYEDGFGVVNPLDETYRFYPNLRWANSVMDADTGELVLANDLPSVITAFTRKLGTVWVGHYNSVAPQAGGGIATPEWLNDSAITPDGGYTTIAASLTMAGEKIGRLFHGNNRGKIYVEDEEVAWEGADGVVAFSHLLMGDPGGSKNNEGKKLTELWSYIKSEESVGEVRVWPGDEYAYPSPISQGVDEWEFPFEPYGIGSNGPCIVTPAYQGTVTAGWKDANNPPGVVGSEFAPYVVRHNIPEVDGRGFTIEYRWPGATGMRKVVVIGFGGRIGPGSVSRRLKTAQTAVG